jgi:hypothetical protein
LCSGIRATAPPPRTLGVPDSYSVGVGCIDLDQSLLSLGRSSVACQLTASEPPAQGRHAVACHRIARLSGSTSTRGSSWPSVSARNDAPALPLAPEALSPFATIGLQQGVGAWANNRPRPRGITHVVQLVQRPRDGAPAESSPSQWCKVEPAARGTRDVDGSV